MFYVPEAGAVQTLKSPQGAGCFWCLRVFGLPQIRRVNAPEGGDFRP